MKDGAVATELKGFDAYAFTLGDLMRGERATLGKSLLDVQRDLRIRATYIAAIENADPSAFQTPGFIAGYVRSYARYLGLDPEEIFQKFCDEAGYDGVHPSIGPLVNPATPAPDGKKSGGKMAPFRAPKNKASRPPVAALPSAGGIFPPQAQFLQTRGGMMMQVSPSAIGSILMLLILVVGLGYGAWALLQDIQRVEIAPRDTVAAAEVADLPIIQPENAGKATSSNNPQKEIALDQLYRPKELEVPVMTPRDGPIAALDPNRIGALVANNGTVQAEKTAKLLADSAPRVTEIAPPQVAVVARRPAWVRITQADGTILFEKILDAGESFVLPADATGATLRAGNAGAVYVSLDDHPYGPIGKGTAVVKNVALNVKTVVDKFAKVSDTAALSALDSPRIITLNNVPAN